MRLAIVPHAAVVQHLSEQIVVIVGQQISKSFAEVPEESLAGGRTLNHPSGENWHPGTRIVSSPFGELRNEVVGPVLRAGFPAVADHVLKAAFAH